MRFYSNGISIQRKKDPKGENASVLKFCIALVVACLFLGYLSWRHAQDNQEIRNLRNELKILQNTRDELAVTLHNQNGALEREMEGRRIMELSNSLKLGLRPPDPKQRIVQMNRKQDNRWFRSQDKMVGSTK